MKIILASYRYYVSGGPEVYMFNIKRLLEDNGHEVIPYSVRCDKNEPSEYASYFPHGKSDSGDAYFANVKKSPKNIARLLSCAFYNNEAYKNLRRLIQDTKPDAVYVLQQINALSPSVFKAAHDEGVRVVHRLSDFNMMCPRSDFLCDGEVCIACIHGDYSKASTQRCCHGSRATTEIRIASMKSHRRRKLFDYIDSFVCPTSFTANKLIESGIDSKKVNVVPTFTLEEAKTSGSEGAYALYLGRISPEKGIDYLIRALPAYPDFELRITGKIEGDYSQSIVSLVDDLGLNDRVKFVGFVSGEEKAKLIAESFCVVCPSVWYENLPNTVLEAYSYAKPVLSFDIGCMPELVQDGVTGIVVPVADIDALGSSISQLWSNKPLAHKMGLAGQALCATKYSSDTHLDELLKVLSPSKTSGKDS